MDHRTLVWRTGVGLAVVGLTLVLLGAYLMVNAQAMVASLTLMVLGFGLVLFAQVTSSLAKRQQGIHYIY